MSLVEIIERNTRRGFFLKNMKAHRIGEMFIVENENNSILQCEKRLMSETGLYYQMGFEDIGVQADGSRLCSIGVAILGTYIPNDLRYTTKNNSDAKQPVDLNTILSAIPL